MEKRKRTYVESTLIMLSSLVLITNISKASLIEESNEDQTLALTVIKNNKKNDGTEEEKKDDIRELPFHTSLDDPNLHQEKIYEWMYPELTLKPSCLRISSSTLLPLPLSFVGSQGTSSVYLVIIDREGKIIPRGSVASYVTIVAVVGLNMFLRNTQHSEDILDISDTCMKKKPPFKDAHPWQRRILRGSLYIPAILETLVPLGIFASVQLKYPVFFGIVVGPYWLPFLTGAIRSANLKADYALYKHHSFNENVDVDKKREKLKINIENRIEKIKGGSDKEIEKWYKEFFLEKNNEKWDDYGNIPELKKMVFLLRLQEESKLKKERNYLGFASHTVEGITFVNKALFLNYFMNPLLDSIIPNKTVTSILSPILSSLGAVWSFTKTKEVNEYYSKFLTNGVIGKAVWGVSTLCGGFLALPSLMFQWNNVWKDKDIFNKLLFLIPDSISEVGLNGLAFYMAFETHISNLLNSQCFNNSIIAKRHKLISACDNILKQSRELTADEFGRFYDAVYKQRNYYNL